MNKQNITPEDLKNKDEFILLHKLQYTNAKNFIVNEIVQNSEMLKQYGLYQTFSLLFLVFIFIQKVIKAFSGSIDAGVFLHIIYALVFSFTILVSLHELIHAIAYKLTGKKNIAFGWKPKQFMFYVTAHNQVMNINEFRIVAFSPFIVAHVVLIPLMVIFRQSDMFWFYLSTFLCHNLFCAGDFALFSYMKGQPHKEVYTYDDRKTETAYFYAKKPDNNR